MQKPCTACGKILSLDMFYVERKRSDGRTSQCKSCMSTRQKLARADPARKGIRITARTEAKTLLEEGKKRCCVCCKVLSKESFCAWKYAPDGLNSRCFDCEKNRRKKPKYRKNATGRALKDSRNLTDSYIKKKLCHRSPLRYSEIPDELVVLKRQHLLIKRTLENFDEKHPRPSSGIDRSF